MSHERALATLSRLPTVTMSGSPASVRSIAIFGRSPTGVSLPLNRKTTQQAIRPIALDKLEPRIEMIPAKGLESYAVRPRTDPPDVAHIVMRDGTERWLIQEGHTRLGAAVLRGDESMPVRVWEFTQNDRNTFDPVIRGRHRIGNRFRDKLVKLADSWDEGQHPRDETGRFSESQFATSVADVSERILKDSGGKLAVLDLRPLPSGDVELETIAVAPGNASQGVGTKAMEALVDWADEAGVRITLSPSQKGYQPVENGPKTTSSDRLKKFYKQFGFVEPKGRHYDPTLSSPTKPRMFRNPKRKDLGGDHVDDVMNFPDIGDVSFPEMIGAIPSKPPRKKRKPVKYKGVQLSRAPMKFEAKVLALSEIPVRLDAAVVELSEPATSLPIVLADIAHYGAMQVLHELVRQGAPESILLRPPNLLDTVTDLCRAVEAERRRDLDAACSEFEARLGKKRLSKKRRAELAAELYSSRAPGIYKRHAKSGVNLMFSIGRNAAIDMFRRPRIDLAYQGEGGKFISKADAIAEGLITVDAVVQTAVMDTNTCEECEDVDGEVMEFGDDRQEELHPPYVKCLGGNRCRCVQIALLSDGSEIDVDEIDEDTLS